MKEIVIKVDDKLYERIASDKEILIYSGVRSGKTLLAAFLRTIIKAIREGKVLPPGHGRISDMDEAIKCIEECKGEDATYAIALIEWACGKRTLIEADKGGTE